jgi:dihydrofolate reductase
VRRVVVINNVTLDGVMQAPGRPDEDTRGGFEHGGWAVMSNSDPALNNAPKYVASRTLREPLPWPNSTLLDGDAADSIAVLKQEPGNDLQIMGGASGEPVQSLMARDLIDQYMLLIHPLVLGSGRRLFADGGGVASLPLLDGASTTSTGVVIATYQTVRE